MPTSSVLASSSCAMTQMRADSLFISPSRTTRARWRSMTFLLEIGSSSVSSAFSRSFDPMLRLSQAATSFTTRARSSPVRHSTTGQTHQIDQILWSLPPLVFEYWIKSGTSLTPKKPRMTQTALVGAISTTLVPRRRYRMHLNTEQGCSKLHNASGCKQPTLGD